LPPPSILAIADPAEALLPVVVRKQDGDKFENLVELAGEEWYLPQQISALEEWLSANEGSLDPTFTWVADVGFVGRPDAGGGGPVLTREFMERCVRVNLEIWLSEYRDGDAGRYGKVVDALLGRDCSATLATNSIKLAFGDGQKGCPYIWIDPPWRLEHEGRCVMASSDYAEHAFKAWGGLLAPLRTATLSAWDDEGGTTSFSFAGGQRLVVLWDGCDVSDESWYSHWYATPGRRGIT
jgi:hypothetical protein